MRLTITLIAAATAFLASPAFAAPVAGTSTSQHNHAHATAPAQDSTAEKLREYIAAKRTPCDHGDSQRDEHGECAGCPKQKRDEDCVDCEDAVQADCADCDPNDECQQHA